MLLCVMTPSTTRNGAAPESTPARLPETPMSRTMHVHDAHTQGTHTSNTYKAHIQGTRANHTYKAHVFGIGRRAFHLEVSGRMVPRERWQWHMQAGSHFRLALKPNISHT